MTVVAAVIEEGGRYLVTRRPRGVHLAGLWEFPGGKIDEAESHAEALRRELREELGADADILELMWSVAHDYADRRVELFFYRCRLRDAPRPVLDQDMRWVPREELPSLEFPPADEELIRRLSQ